MKQMIKKLAVVFSVALVCAPMGAMAANKLIVKDAAGVVDKMVVTDTGYIGIGTSAPTSSIEVVGPASSSRFILGSNETSAAGGGGIIATHSNLPAVNGGYPQANDRLGYILFGTKNASGNLVIGGGFSVQAEQAWSLTSAPTFYSFQTAPVGSAGRVERMRLTSAGNLGINTSAPTQKLEVNGGMRLNPTVATPLCDAVNGPNNRGTFWYVKGATGVAADSLQVCYKNLAGAYSWRVVF